MTKRLYIAATNQHVGKTTCTLGLVEAFIERGNRVGYCKPVGQEAVDFENIHVDKDALLFATMMHFPLIAHVHSPVILGPGATKEYLDNPQSHSYKENIRTASHEIEKDNEIVIYEGTGHPGVGSVVDLSNADVAKMLGAPVILVVEGGIGYTIDRLKLCLALFQQQDVPIAGVIINKVHPEKREKVRHYVGMKLNEWNIPLLGVLPYDRTLLYPLLDTIRNSIQGRVLLHTKGLSNLVETVVAASLLAKYDFKDQQGVLLVVSKNRLNESLQRIRLLVEENQINHQPLTGVIITGDGRLEEKLDEFNEIDFVTKYQIPMISTPLDTYGTAVQINRMEVKINTQTMGKARRAVELVRDNVDLEKIKW
jgi:dethiobiotin synthetase